MNKSELIDVLAEHVGGKATAQKAVEVIVDQIQRAVTSGDKVQISGFGVFERQERAARTGRNPSTGAPVKIKKSAAPKFRPGTDFKAYVNGTKKYGRTSASAAKATVKAAATTAKTTTAKVAAPAKKVVTKAVAKAPVAKAAPVKKAAPAPVKKAPAAKAPVAKKVAAPAKKAPAKKTTR